MGEEKEERKQLIARIPVELHKAAFHAAIDKGISLTEWVEEAIREKLQRE